MGKIIHICRKYLDGVINEAEFAEQLRHAMKGYELELAEKVAKS